MAPLAPARPAPSAPYINRRDGPYLLPSNRKLRNLVSISLRNISLDAPTAARRRGKTIDDDAVPYSLRSPAKIVALREQAGKLEYSRSSTDLRSVSEHAVIGEGVGEENGAMVGRVENGSPVKGKSKAERPRIGRMRRRSTLEWINATPQRRQERLERVTEERMLDVVFSLHVEGFEEPVYVSETVSKTMNPTFRYVDLSACGPGITRLAKVEVKVWVRRVGKGEVMWRGLLDLELDLRHLQYLGKSLDNLTHPLPTNALVLHLKDGVYTPMSTSLETFIPPPQYSLSAAPPTRSASSRILPSSSFDALLRLAKLDDSIQDALSVRNKLASDLENLLQRNREPLEARDRVKEAEDRLKTIEYAQTTVNKQVSKAKKQIEEKQTSLRRRRELMHEDLDRRKLEQKAMTASLPEVPSLRDEREIRKRAIHAQRRRICEDLQKVYPISPIPKQSLAFTIRDLHLPNSEDLDSSPSDNVAAALGHIAHIIQLLSYYLSQPLLYPVTVRGSTSTISDPISLLKTTASTTQRYSDEESLRTYPLYSKGVPRFRFEYAVFLLNKNILLLLETVYAVRVLDIRQTLPNLKYLLYVATAGEGELPARKAGGVRGLLRARKEGEGEGRKGSDASSNASTFVGIGGGEGKKGGADKANGKPKGGNVGAVESLRRNIGPLPNQGKRKG